jgi:hypothetical protein
MIPGPDHPLVLQDIIRIESSKPIVMGRILHAGWVKVNTMRRHGQNLRLEWSVQATELGPIFGLRCVVQRQGEKDYSEAPSVIDALSKGFPEHLATSVRMLLRMHQQYANDDRYSIKRVSNRDVESLLKLLRKEELTGRDAEGA